MYRRGDDQRFPIERQGLQQWEALEGGDGVQACGRLVQQQHIWREYQLQRNGQPFLLTPTDGPGLHPSAPDQTKHLQHIAHIYSVWGQVCAGSGGQRFPLRAVLCPVYGSTGRYIASISAGDTIVAVVFGRKSRNLLIAFFLNSDAYLNASSTVISSTNASVCPLYAILSLCFLWQDFLW